MRTARTLAVMAALSLPACQAGSSDAPSSDAAASSQPHAIARATAAPLTAARMRARLSAAGLVASALASDGTPRLVWATTKMAAPAGATPEQAARAHLARLAPAFGVSADALATLQLQRVHVLHGGAKLAIFRPRIDGLEVYRGDVSVLMRADGSLVAIRGTPRRDALPARRVRPDAFRLDAQGALAIALADHSGAPVTASDVVALAPDRHGDLRFELRRGAPLALSHTARARKVLLAQGPQLVPAWWIEAWAPGKTAPALDGVFDAVIDAKTGQVLVREERTAFDAFSYRVWTDGTDHRPTDGPIADYTPHPTGMPDGSTPAFTAPALVSMEGFDHNPNGTADPWLPAGATQSQGNNIDAYTDDDSPDGFSPGDIRATTTAAGTFDRTYDTAADPQSSADQKQAAIIQAFYTTNWLHDWWYDSGFDEAAGDGQADNYGRGGLDGDPMHVEIQDGAAQGNLNNANMSAASDGESPRMQMYLWSGQDFPAVTLTPGGTVSSLGAAFGLTTVDVTAPVVLAVDGTAPTSDACEALTNDVTGKIVLADRGTCTFKQKAVNAQAAGAAGLIIANNQAGAGPMAMSDGTPAGTVGIGVFSISMEDGTALKTALGAGAVTAHLTRHESVERDGGIDNTVVAHEWGHYLHLRLASCGQAQCSAMSEGWADFNALMMVLRPGDDLDGTYALAQYAAASFGDAYFGIRRAPYAHDMAKNGFTFKDISDGQALPMTPLNANGQPNSEAHNAGEIWAEWLFEAYTGLLRETTQPGATRTWEQVHRTMSDYVVAGLEMTPPDATYTEQRDAILAAATAVNPADATTMAQAFARRGAGSCAVSPAPDSTDFTGVVESYDVSPSLAISDAALDESTMSCDDDGVLDPGEAGHLVLTVHNGGPATLSGATLTATTTTTGATVTSAPVTVPDLAPFSSTTVSFDVALDATATPKALLDIEVATSAPGACTTTSTFSFQRLSDLDVAPNASATDDVEAPTTVWTLAGTAADTVWARTSDGAAGHLWHGDDLGEPSDTQLVSPPLQVSATKPLSVTFRERHDFEASMGTNWDGGVIELSSDGGQTWTDVGAAAAPGYGGSISAMAGNPLAGKAAFVGRNPSYPAMDSVTLDLGTAYAGQTVQLRFRIGTDEASGAGGWDLDDLAFSGIDNTPFPAIVDNAGTCNRDGSGSDMGSDAGGKQGGGCCEVGGAGGGAGGALALCGLVALAVVRRRRRA